MTPSNWIEIGKLITQIITTIIPFGFIFLIFILFKKDLKSFIKNGGWRVSAPGVSIEASQKQQQEVVGKKEKEELATLNKELQTAKEREKRLAELQKFTATDRDSFFLGFHFERTYRIIFPSQMVILNALKNFNAEINDEFAKTVYQDTIWAQNFNVTFEQFIGFLTEAGLIECNANKMKITNLGQTFMKYLTDNNIYLKIPPTDKVNRF